MVEWCFEKKEVKESAQFIEQLIVPGNQSLFIYQPHNMERMEDAQWLETLEMIEKTSQQFIDQGMSIVFFIEEASRRVHPQRKKFEQWLSGSGSLSQREYSLERLRRILQEQGGSEATYAYNQFRVIFELQKQCGSDKVWGVLEDPIRSVKAVGQQILKDIGSSGTNPCLRFNRYKQLIAHVAVRDLHAAGQILKMREEDPTLAHIVFRGPSHIGFSTALEVLSRQNSQEEKPPIIDLYKPQPVKLSNIFTYVAAEIVWSEKFWQQIIEKEGLNLRLLRLDPVLKRVQSITRKLLHQEPWNSHLQEKIQEISPNRQGWTEIILTQEVF